MDDLDLVGELNAQDDGGQIHFHDPPGSVAKNRHLDRTSTWTPLINRSPSLLTLRAEVGPIVPLD